ncbi:MAG: DUF1631 domain-containing protein [Vicinamibacterales bacterium]|nr:DUF1631 domain-containing protein [Vicinamibacterales bacterium]
MATAADSLTLALQARRVFTERLVKGLPKLVNEIAEAANVLRDQPTDHAGALRRREFAQAMQHGAAAWHQAMVGGLRTALLHGAAASRPMDLPGGGREKLTLVDDATIEREILSSRLALAMMDRAAWDFADVRARVARLEHREELESNDMLRAHVLARIIVEAWHGAGLALEGWRELQRPVHEAFATLVEAAYRQVKAWLDAQHVVADDDLRARVRRQQESQVGADVGYYASYTGGRHAGAGGVGEAGHSGGSAGGSAGSGAGGSAGVRDDRVAARGGVGEETRLMTRTTALGRSVERAETVLERLNRLVGRHLPGFAQTRAGAAVVASPPLRQAMAQAERDLRVRLDPASLPSGGATVPALLEPLNRQREALKKAAQTPVERATIEIVALLFQSILTEERIPPTVRVWFARLQMPVLRVAVSEPDFFATIDHPARRLIDRMGACVMGFDDAAAAGGDALESEIRRIVQVVEAYPDTGRRVFQTVLTEFEKFLEHYFKDANEASRKGVSLAQQVEQREEKAIQYTIELRNMLADVPVQEGVRQFLFQVWADVLAMAALKSGPQSGQTRTLKTAAAELIWSAGAKVTREERGEVIRKLPGLLKTLRDGMALAGYPSQKQDERIAELNNALAAAFTAKAAAIAPERLDELKERLETLEEMLPDTAHLQIDESQILDLSGHESSELEVVTTGGSPPTAAMLAWARELQVGTWFMLDYRNRHEAVQLAWRGLNGQLSLFVSRSGRCVLFQRQPLAAFLQAGLLQPAQDESLTVRATRTALAKLDVDPFRLLN